MSKWLFICLGIVLAFHILGRIIAFFWVFKDQSIFIKGYQLNYKVLGAGAKDVLLIHGMFSSLHCWDLMASLAQDKYRFITIDLPEIRQSYSSCSSNPEECIEEILKDFCQQLGLNHPHIVGCSLGGLIAYLSKIKYPQLFDKCLMVAPPFSPRFFFLPVNKLHIYRLHYLAPALNLFINPLIVGYTHLRTAGRNFKFYRVMNILSKFRKNTYFKTSLNYFHLISRSEESVGKLSPIEDYSIIWGTKDHLVQPQAFQALRNKNPDLAYHVIPEALHHPMESHPKEFYNIMDQILRAKAFQKM